MQGGVCARACVCVCLHLFLNPLPPPYLLYWKYYIKRIALATENLTDKALLCDHLGARAEAFC